MAGETGRHPYLLRQDAMEEVLDEALADDRGLSFLGAATGSGKNYVAARWCARQLLAGAAPEGGFAGLGPEAGAAARARRSVIAVVIPNKANRSAFRGLVVEFLENAGWAPDVAERAVVEVAAEGDGLLGLIRAGRAGERPIARADAKPELARGLEARWEGAVRAGAAYIEVAGIGAGKDTADFARTAYARAERDLRRFVEHGEAGEAARRGELLNEEAARAAGRGRRAGEGLVRRLRRRVRHRVGQRGAPLPRGLGRGRGIWRRP